MVVLYEVTGVVESEPECCEHARSVITVGNGYSVLLAVCSAICPASFGHVLPICMGQNILVNELIFFMPLITNEWAKFDTKDMFLFYFFSHASPTSTT